MGIQVCKHADVFFAQMADASTTFVRPQTGKFRATAPTKHPPKTPPIMIYNSHELAALVHLPTSYLQ